MTYLAIPSNQAWHRPHRPQGHAPSGWAYGPALTTAAGEHPQSNDRGARTRGSNQTKSDLYTFRGLPLPQDRLRTAKLP